MLIQDRPTSGTAGPKSMKLAGEAEQLVAVLWQQALTEMSATATPSGGGATGAGLYNSLGLHALAEKMAGSVAPGLTQAITRELETRHKPAIKQTGQGMPLASTLAAAQSLSGASPTASVVQTAETGATPAGAIGFAKSIWPAIKSAAAALDAPPVALLAQAALETGWGASAPDNNFFGIKAIDGQTATVEPTTEQIGDKLTPTSARFAAYPSISNAFQHYVSLVRSGFSSAVGSTSVSQYADALAQGGWATDSAYAQKLVDIATSPMMGNVLGALGISPPGSGQ